MLDPHETEGSYVPDPPPRVGWPRMPVIIGIALALVAVVSWVMSKDWTSLFWLRSSSPVEETRPPAPKMPSAALPRYTTLPPPLYAAAEVTNGTTPAGDDEASALKARVAALERQFMEKTAPAPVAHTPAVPQDTSKQRRQRRQQEEAERKRREDVQKAWKSGGGSLKPSEKDTKMSLQSLKTPWSLPPGTKINCRTATKISNEVQGVFLAEVTRRVRNLAGETVIPQGTTLIGQPSGRSIYGDSRIGVSMSTMTFPNRTYLEFPKATGADQAGTAGFTGDIDRHLLQNFGAIILTGVLRGGSTLIGGGLGYGLDQDPAQAIGGAVASETSRQGEQQVRQSIRTDPTITVERSYGCLIILEREMVLPGPYPEL